jgi:hypothetical protein
MFVTNANTEVNLSLGQTHIYILRGQKLVLKSRKRDQQVFHPLLI